MKKLKIFMSILVVFLITAISNVNAEIISTDNNYYTLDHTGDVKTMKLLKDVPASEFNTIFNTAFSDIAIEKSIVIDGNNHKITLDSDTATSMIDLGGIKTKGAIATYDESEKIWKTTDEGEYAFDGKITFKGVHFIGNAEATQKVMLVYINLPHADITFQSCQFEKYQKAAIWAANFRKMTIDDSNFDGSYIKVSEDTNNLYLKSSEHISLCMGDEFSSKAFNSYKIESISITNNVFTDISKVSENGTSAIKLKLKNKTVVTGVEQINIKNNRFENNMVDVVIGEKNPETTLPVENPTTFDDSANLNINFENNTSTNDDGVKILSVYNTTTVPLEADRTTYISNTNKSSTLLNLVSKLYLVKNIDKSLTIKNSSDLEESLQAIKDSSLDSSNVLKLEETNYNITFSVSDIKENLLNTITDLSLNISTTIPADLKDKAKEGSVIISSLVSGELPVNQLIVRTKIPEFANKKVELYYNNVESGKLDLLGTYTADSSGNIDVKLTHYSTFILTPVAGIPNPETGDGIINILIIAIISTITIIACILFLNKQKN